MASSENERDGPLGALYHAIGLFVVRVSLIDYLLSITLLAMISPGDNALTIATPLVSGTDFRVKLSMIRHLAAMHGAEQRATINHACNALQKLFVRRNMLCHSTTEEGRTPDELSFLDMRLNGDSEFNPPTLVKTADVVKWTEKLGASYAELKGAVQASGYGWIKQPPSPELAPMTAPWKRELRAALQSQIDPPKPQKPPARPRKRKNQSQ